VAIARRTVVVAGRARGFEAVSARDGVVDRFDPDTPRTGGWTDYLAGVVRVLRRRGAAPAGAAMSVASAVPIGAGLSSSAALTVAAARALAALAGVRLGQAELADIAYEAEHDEVGVRCGRMDQTIAAFAVRERAMLFETPTGTRRMVPFRGRVWVFETGVTHRLAGGELNRRRHECEDALRILADARIELPALAALPAADLPRALAALPPTHGRRVRHVVTETARTRAAADALARGDLSAVGALLLEGHRSLRDDFESSCPEADLLVDLLARHGAWGARLTGAGWGGAVIALIPAARAPRVVAEVQDGFRRELGRVPEVWDTPAGAGVRGERVRR
jgi:galactokinase